MELSTSYFATCTKAEVLLLQELAKEHRNRLRVKQLETTHAMQIVIETDGQQLRDYIYFMLQRLRDRQRALEKVFNDPPGQASLENAPRRPVPPPDDPCWARGRGWSGPEYRQWQA